MVGDSVYGSLPTPLTIGITIAIIIVKGEI